MATLAYVVIELRYNRSLLALFSLSNPSKEVIDRLSNEGKLLASIGITWAFGRGPIQRLRNPIAILLTSVFAVGGMYWTISSIYDHTIHNLSPSTKVDGWHLAAYRQSLLNGKLVDPDIPLPAQVGAIGSIVMTSFPLVMFDDRYMVPARDILERKATDFERHMIRQAEQRWPAYSSNMDRLNSLYQEYLQGSARAVQFGQAGIKEFRKRSGGMDPNPKATREMFLQKLRGSSHPEVRRLNAAESEIIWIDNKGKPTERIIYGRDIPYFMNHTQYYAWFRERAKHIRLQVLPTVETVERTEGINDINAAVFIPPMAMITSLLSVIANVAALLVIAVTALFALWPKSWGIFHRYLWIFGPTVTITALVASFMLASGSIFSPGTPMHDLEKTMHHEVGWPGKLWSKAASIQLIVFNHTHLLGGARE